MICTALRPSNVTRPPPSMTVSTPVGRFIVDAIGMVTAADPQLNVITPPRLTAAFSAVKVQLAAVPVPTTVVGRDTSAGCAPAGRALVQCVGIGVPPAPAAPAPPVPPPAPVPPEPVLPALPVPPPAAPDHARSS